VPAFQLYWDRYIKVPMNFDEYDLVYPDVPEQSLDNKYALSM
jgi:hypothetical protein